MPLLVEKSRWSNLLGRPDSETVRAEYGPVGNLGPGYL